MLSFSLERRCIVDTPQKTGYRYMTTQRITVDPLPSPVQGSQCLSYDDGPAADHGVGKSMTSVRQFLTKPQP